MLRPSRAWLACALVALALLARAQYAVVTAKAVPAAEQRWDDPLTLELDDLDGMLCLAAAYGDIMRDSQRGIANGLEPVGIVLGLDAPRVYTPATASDATRGPPLRSVSALVTTEDSFATHTHGSGAGHEQASEPTRATLPVTPAARTAQAA